MNAEPSPIPSSEPPPAGPPAPAAFDNPAEEADFRATQELLRNPPRSQQKTVVLLISLVAFGAFWLLQGGGSLVDLAILAGVLMVHELGHALAMYAFGYQDVSIFFIPLFGAAASGRPRGVSRSKQAIVLLLGPLPGLAAGCVLAWLGGPPWLHTTAVMLLFVNAINLLPVEPLDGGRLFQILVFSRNRHLELVFRGVTAAVVLVASIYFKFWILAAVGYFLLVTLPQRARFLAGAEQLRRLGLPDDPTLLDEAQQRTLFRTAWNSLPASWHAKWRGKPRPQAGNMEQLLARAAQRPPSVAASLGIFVLWLAGVALTLVGAVAIAGPPSASSRWHRYENRAAAFAIDLPGTVQTRADQTSPGPHDGVATAISHGAQYDVIWFSVASSTDWLRKMRTQMAARDDRVRDAELPADEYAFRSSIGEYMRCKLIAGDNGYGYIVTITPGTDPHVRRVFDSFEARANPRF